MLWIDTEHLEEPSQQSDEFWANHRVALENGEFWADRINELKDEPEARYELARANLPLPAAFREAAVALRAMIRPQRKEGSDWEILLSQLYNLAACESMMIDYAPRLKQPGYNVMESIPGRLVTGLEFSYDTLGYRELRLLNKTDVKWLVEAWGEPNSHTTMNAMHKSTWDRFEDASIIKEKEGSKRFVIEHLALRDDSNPPTQPQARQFQERRWWKFW